MSNGDGRQAGRQAGRTNLDGRRGIKERRVEVEAVLYGLFGDREEEQTVVNVEAYAQDTCRDGNSTRAGRDTSARTGSNSEDMADLERNRQRRARLLDGSPWLRVLSSELSCRRPHVKRDPSQLAADDQISLAAAQLLYYNPRIGSQPDAESTPISKINETYGPTGVRVLGHSTHW